MTINEIVEKTKRTLDTEFELLPIRLENMLRKRRESLREFLYLFFTDWNFEKNTIVKGTKRLQCEKGCRRSLDDIYGIVKYYYRGATLLDVVDILHNDLMKRDGFRTSPCTTIEKRVYYYEKESRNLVFMTEWIDQHGLNYNQWTRKANEHRRNKE